MIPTKGEGQEEEASFLSRFGLELWNSTCLSRIKIDLRDMRCLEFEVSGCEEMFVRFDLMNWLNFWNMVILSI